MVDKVSCDCPSSEANEKQTNQYYKKSEHSQDDIVNYLYLFLVDISRHRVNLKVKDVVLGFYGIRLNLSPTLSLVLEEMKVVINSKLEIPASEIQWRFSRSSGSGGQNLNKTDSRVEIIFNVNKSKTLTSFQKHRISSQDETKLINGCICIAVQEKRTQYLNRQVALSRLASTLRDLLKSPPKKRRETKPTRSSQRKRVESKKKRGDLKRKRQSKIDY